MARDVEALVLMMDANIARFEKAMNRAEGRFDKTANSIEKRQQRLDRSLSNLGGKMGDFARPAQIGATVALGAITALSYQAAKRAEDVNGAFEQTFRDMPEKASAATKAISAEFKRLETDIKDNFTQLQAVMIGLGVDAQQSLAIVDQLQRRSLDMAAFKGGTDAQAFQAIISGITGETEPLKRFGIVVNETAVKTELLRLGFKGNAEQASESAKAIARANLILAKSVTMHGQVAREAGNAANKEKELQAAFVGSAEKLGKQFLPVAVRVLDWAGKALEKFNALPTAAQNAGLGFLALVAVGGPLLTTVNMLRELVKAAVAARVALAGVGGTVGAGAGGGAAGDVLRGAGGGWLARTLPLATGAVAVGVGLASFAPAPYRGDDLQMQLEQARKDQQQADALAKDTFLKSDNVVREQRERLAAANARVSDLSRQVAVRDANAQRQEQARVQAKADQESAAALAGLGDFALSPGQMTGLGGGQASGRAEAADAQRLASRREELALQRAIDLARATGDKAAERAAEERRTLAQLTAEYSDAGYADAVAQATEHLALLNQAEMAAEARAKAEEQIDALLEGRRRQMEREADYAQRLNDQLLDRLGMEAQLASLRGDRSVAEAKERELWIEQRINDLLRDREGGGTDIQRREARDVAGREADAIDHATAQGRFRDLVVSAGRDFEGSAARAGDYFKQRALEGLADALFNIIGSSFGGKGGVGIKALLDFIPGFDMGGYTGAGPRAKPAGVVHAGEVVFSQRDVARHGGPAAVDALRLGLKGYADGGIVGAPVLSAARAAMLNVGAVTSVPASPAVMRFDLRGAVVTEDLLAQMNEMAGRAEQRAVAHSDAASARQTAAKRYRLK
ncbi:MAG: phage tail tape measure protein [Brevundimonas sp.]|uniref:hypothetical protein n=1 Tax=Brevundimonas sp. TaxID=1871086 RepID=UPI001A1C387A|nr:hypothetical protein [Brevundimonas sp.]MBJ7319341.1 phage tail tape measure protein [Brevundimonas sp.]